MCPWAGLALFKMSDAETRTLGRGVMEELVDRLEIGLREGGVGDMKVGVHVRKYAAALHGRVRRYAKLLDTQDWDGLEKALGEHGVGKQVATELQARLGEVGTGKKARRQA